MGGVYITASVFAQKWAYCDDTLLIFLLSHRCCWLVVLFFEIPKKSSSFPPLTLWWCQGIFICLINFKWTEIKQKQDPQLFDFVIKHALLSRQWWSLSCRTNWSFNQNIPMACLKIKSWMRWWWVKSTRRGSDKCLNDVVKLLFTQLSKMKEVTLKYARK